MAAGQWLLAHRAALVQGPIPPAFAPLAWMGRWSLSWYMLHQPVMIGALMLVQWVR
jgi:peptidoglycan/LPS O-acetylase OafA/YrhL